MTELMFYLLGTLERGIIIFLLLLAAERILRSKTGFLRNGFYYLLLLVLITPFAIFSFHGFPQPTAVRVVSETSTVGAPIFSGSLSGDADSGTSEAQGVSGIGKPDRLVAYLRYFDWYAVGGMFYLVSVTLIVAGKIIRWQRWQRLLNTCQEVEGERLQQLFALARKLTGMEGWKIFLVDGSTLSSSPACYGFRNARIIFPALESDFRSDQEIIMLLMHELAHIRRRDYPVRLLLDFMASFYWFNPVFRALHSRLLQAQEVSCDAMVVQWIRLSSDGRRQYARLLFDFAVGSPWEKGLPVPGLSRKGQTLKKRVLEILCEYRDSGVVLPLLLFSLIALAGLLTPIWEPVELSDPAAFPTESIKRIMEDGRLPLLALNIPENEPLVAIEDGGRGSDFQNNSEAEEVAADFPSEVAGAVWGLDYHFDLAGAWRDKKEKLRRTVDFERVRATARYMNSERTPVERLKEERKILAIAGRIAWKEPDRLIALARKLNDHNLAERIEREAAELLGQRI